MHLHLSQLVLDEQLLTLHSLAMKLHIRMHPAQHDPEEAHANKRSVALPQFRA